MRRRAPWLVTLAAAAAMWASALVVSQGRVPLGLDLYVPEPVENPSTPEKIALGRRLFFDTVLSADRTIACSSCHVPEKGFANGSVVAVGVFGRTGSRNVPTLVNRAYGRAFFWDGRTDSLEEQVLKPIEDPVEMDLDRATAVARLQQDARYRALFGRVFGGPVTATNLARALAAFTRSILAGDSAVDRYLGGDRSALNDRAVRGLELFRGAARCDKCHHGTNFTDESFHNTGVSWKDDTFRDLGRAMVTGAGSDRGAFKTPTLRQVALTAPYMHDGSLATLADVVDFYNRGGRANAWLDPDLRPLALSADDRAALVVFLEALGSNSRQ